MFQHLQLYVATVSPYTPSYIEPPRFTMTTFNPELLPIPSVSSLVPGNDKVVGAFLTASLLSVARYLGSGPRTSQIPLESVADAPRGEEELYPPPLCPPNVEITGGSRSISIKLGKNAAATNHTPEQQLHLLSRRLVPGGPLKVVAELASGQWSKPGCFRNLGQYLAILGDEVPFKHWEDLTIRLPDDDLSYDWNSYRIPEHTFENLRHLNWSGHRQQLASSWLPFSPSLLHPLTTLIMSCDVSFEDCSRLLFYGEQLKHFELHSIRSDVQPVLYFLRYPSEFHSRYRTRPCLESLILTSSQDVVPLLRLLKFSALHTINFDLLYPTDFASLPSDFWATLKMVILRGDISDGESRWIRNKCSAGTKHEHIYRGRAS